MQGPNTITDSLQYFRYQFMKAAGYSMNCDQANDSIIARASREIHFLQGEHRFLATRHALGIFLGLVFFTIVIAVLIWKGRKIKEHYEALIAVVNEERTHMADVQKRLQEYDSDFEPYQVLKTEQVSRWPRFYNSIILGSHFLFILFYFVLAF